MKLNSSKILIAVMIFLSSCSTKQYHYDYSLVSNDIPNWNVSTNLSCLIGTESRLMSLVVGGKVDQPHSWEAVCNAQFNGKPSVSLSGSNLPSGLEGVLVFGSGRVSLVGRQGKLNVFGQCIHAGDTGEAHDCLRYETDSFVEFSSLAPAFYMEFSIEGKNSKRLYFKIKKLERIH